MMFPSITSRTLSVTSVMMRAPLIQFRHGASRSAKPSSTAAPAQRGAVAGAQSTEAIYDFQIPQRWKRRPISEEEIAYINRGGPE